MIIHYGILNLSVLMNYFDIARTQASRDVNEYIEIAPNNLEYSTKLKAYVKSAKFKAVFD